MQRALLAPNAYDDAVLSTPGLVGYWPLDDNQGTVARDLSINKLNGIYQSGSTLHAAGPASNASAVSLNGSTGYVLIADNNALDVGDVITQEIWVRRNRISFGANEGIFSKELSSVPAFIPANTIDWYCWGSGLIRASTIAIAETLFWHHLVFCKNGSTRLIYIDSIECGTGGTNQTMVNTATAMHIGADAPTAVLWLGASIARAAMYNRALTAAEVKSHYTLGVL